jgi:hypothetical protein
MARLVLGAVGAVVGFYFGGPAGAQAGFALGSMAGGALEPNAKVQGPRLADLKAPAATYGSPIPYIEGHPRLGGVWVWCSDKREIATTESQGKGGPGVDSTSYTYEMDVLIVVCEGTFAGVRRVWNNGKLAWTAADDATTESLQASLDTTLWREMRVYTGAADQLPDPTYEAAFGVGNVPAMRDRGTIVIEGLNLGGSGQAPLLTFEACSAGSATTDVNLVFDVPFDGNPDDVAADPITPTVTNSSYISYATAGSAVFTVAEEVPLLGGELTYTGGKLATDHSQKFTVEASLAVLEAQASVGGTTTGDNDRFLRFTATSGSAAAFGFRVVDGEVTLSTTVSHFGSSTTFHGPVAGVNRYRIVIDDPDGTVSFYLGSVLLRSESFVASPETIVLGLASHGAPAVTAYRFDRVRAYYGEAPNDFDLITADDVPLDEVVLRQCQRGGLDASLVDVTALATKNVRALAVTQVTAPRAVIDTLMAAYLFEAFEAEKLTFVFRGGAPVATIPFADLGAIADSTDTPEPLPLTKSNETEIPQQVVIKFANVDDDYQDGAESSDRLLVGGKGVQAVEIPLGLTPTEAKRLANAVVMDYAASMIRVGPVSLTREHAALVPTDVVLLLGEGGSTFRTRLQRRSEAGGVLTFEGVLDDATVINSAAVTSGGYNSSTLVRSVVDTVMRLLDMPILLDVDNTPGFYVAAKGTDSTWPGYSLLSSIDDVTYGKVYGATGAAVMGLCTTTLGDFAGGAVFDEVNSVTVDVGAGTLASITRAALLAGVGNAALVGSEVIRFRTATLSSAGIYVLSGLLRGQRGTEWAIGGHTAAERFVLLQTTGLRRVTDQQSDIGITKYWKGVTFGKSAALVSSTPFADTGIGLLPFSPVDVRAARSSGDITLTWKRRTRLSTRFVGSGGINVPLGEASEAYSVDIMDGDTVVRTIATTAATLTYSSADQTADFGAPQSSLTVRVYQISATVGRGYPAEATL